MPLDLGELAGNACKYERVGFERSIYMEKATENDIPTRGSSTFVPRTSRPRNGDMRSEECLEALEI